MTAEYGKFLAILDRMTKVGQHGNTNGDQKLCAVAKPDRPCIVA